MPLTPFSRPSTERELFALGTPFGHHSSFEIVEGFCLMQTVVHTVGLYTTKLRTTCSNSSSTSASSGTSSYTGISLPSAACGSSSTLLWHNLLLIILDGDLASLFICLLACVVMQSNQQASQYERSKALQDPLYCHCLAPL